MKISKSYQNFSAEVVADSYTVINGTQHRIASLVVNFPRIVLAEFNTHRLFSRNSASSRAIPIKTMLKRIVENPFVPNRFPGTHKGMQATEDNWIKPGDELYDRMCDAWLAARDIAVETVANFDKLGISKQLANRLLEPFMMHRVIVTATEWENFFALRTDYSAQNEIRIVAQLMLEAMNESKPNLLQPGEWHSPFSDKLDPKRLQAALSKIEGEGKHDVGSIAGLKRMIAIARCARVSYHNYEGKDDYIADVGLYMMLRDMGHMSPFEHAARAMTEYEYNLYCHGSTSEKVELGWCGNFRGFIQARKLFPQEVENRTFTDLA